MKPIIKICAVSVFLINATGTISAQDLAQKNFRFFGKDLVNDIRHFYTLNTLTTWSMSLFGSALLAYTPIDPTISYTYQKSIRCPASNDVSEIFNRLGVWKMTWPGYLVLSVFDYIPWKREPTVLRTVGNWASRSSRALAVGWPTVALFQRVVGSPRPIYGTSNWQPFRYATGVSGHAFVGVKRD